MPALGWWTIGIILLGCVAYWFAAYKARRPNYRRSLEMIEEARALYEAHEGDNEKAQEAWAILYRVAYRYSCRIPLVATSFDSSAEYLERFVIEEREDAMEALTLQELTNDKRSIWAILGYINEATDGSWRDPDLDATIGSPHLIDCREALLSLTDKYGIACDLTSDAESAADGVRREIEHLIASKTAATAQAH